MDRDRDDGAPGKRDQAAGPNGLSPEALREAGLRIGLPSLSVSAVAGELGVSRAAIHRHVSGRRGLEDLVGTLNLGSAPGCWP